MFAPVGRIWHNPTVMASNKPKPPKRRKPKHRTEPPELTAREVRFCAAYVELGNATAAAERAGIVATRGSLSTLAWRMLKKVEIRTLIRRMQQEAADAEQVSINRLAHSLGQEAFADRTAIFDAKGQVKPPQMWPAALRALVVGIDVEEVRGKTGKTTVRYKVRFVRGTEAKKVLAQWRGMIGADRAESGAPAEPLVVGGESSPESL